MVAARFDHHTRTAIIDYRDTPATPYDLFLTINHLVALGAERSDIIRENLDEAISVINDLFYLVEYDISDPIMDLFEDECITIETFFRRYGIRHEVFQLDDDESTASPVGVEHFPMESDDESSISSEDEGDLAMRVYIDNNF